MSEWEDMPDEGWEDVPQTAGPVTPQSPLEAGLSTAYSQLQNVGEGATLGFRDEAEAALSGIYDERPYTVRLADIERRRAQANVGNEWELPAKLSGGLLTGALTGRVVNPTSMVGTGALAGTEGLIAGAGLSSGTFQDDPQQLAQDALIGGGIGVGAAAGLGVAGAGLGFVGNLAYRSMRPMAQRTLAWIRGAGDDARMTTHQRNLRTAEELDIPTTAPERLGDDTLMAKQARYESDEILQRAVNPTLEGRAARVNQIARQEIGLGPGDDINRFDLGEASRGIKAKFQSVESQYQPVKMNQIIASRLDDVAAPGSIVKPPEKALTAVTRTRELLDEGMSGTQYMRERSLLDKEIQALYKSEKPDVRLAETYAEIIDTLDDAFARQLEGTPAAEVLALARRQWKNLRLLDRPNAVQGGDVRLGGIKTGLNRNKGFLRGMDQTPMARLADLADSTKFNFGRSGTAERSPFNVLQRLQSTAEMPMANAVINRGGMLGPPGGGLPGSAVAGAVPALQLGAEDQLGLGQ